MIPDFRREVVLSKNLERSSVLALEPFRDAILTGRPSFIA